MSQKYRAKKGAMFSQKKAQVYGKQLDNLKTNHEGILTPRIVVNEAKNIKSPLHDCFTWQNKKAAEQYRLSEARHLMNHIEVIDIIIKNDKEVEMTRPLVFNLKIDNGNGQQYYDSMLVLNDEDLRKRLLDQAMNEVERWQERYEKFIELVAIISAINKTKKKYKNKKK